ncbi:MAG: ABC transporter permease, partial [Pseudomonadota bacterium]|nr:ABC transporter permease [Pseudomonadota bacterium]
MNNVAMIIGKRLGLGVLTMFMVSVIIFLAVNMLPGDFAQALLGQSATPEAVAAIRKDLGLDKPIHTRYFDWLIGVMQFDFGTSFAKANFATYAGTTADVNFGSVAEQIAPRFANTLFLAAVTAAIAVPLSLLIGVLAALYRYSIFDRIANISTLTSISSPEFFVAYVLILLLAVLNPVFPSLSNIHDGMDFAQKLQKTMLPALTLTLVVTAHMMRMTRAAIINLL